MISLWRCKSCGSKFPLELDYAHASKGLHPLCHCASMPPHYYSFCEQVGVVARTEEIVETDIDNVVLPKPRERS